LLQQSASAVHELPSVRQPQVPSPLQNLLQQSWLAKQVSPSFEHPQVPVLPLQTPVQQSVSTKHRLKSVRQPQVNWVLQKLQQSFWFTQVLPSPWHPQVKLLLQYLPQQSCRSLHESPSSEHPHVPVNVLQTCLSQQSASAVHELPSVRHPQVPSLLQNLLQQSCGPEHESPSMWQPQVLRLSHTFVQQSASPLHPPPSGWHPHVELLLHRPPQQSGLAAQKLPSGTHPQKPSTQWLVQQSLSLTQGFWSAAQAAHVLLWQTPPQQSAFFRHGLPVPWQGAGWPEAAAAGVLRLSMAGGTHSAAPAAAAPVRNRRRGRVVCGREGVAVSTDGAPGARSRTPRSHRSRTRRAD
jgi:hypothetical protein